MYYIDRRMSGSCRNHHSVHTGCITELATGFPGYDGQWARDASCIAEILRGNQYATAAFGKWHNTHDHELGAGRPYDRWPVGKGFDYFYGFQGGESNNGIRLCSRIPLLSSHRTTTRSGISLRLSPGRRSAGSASRRHPRRTNHSSSISRRAPLTPRITCIRSEPKLRSRLPARSSK
jgi:Sulfatase